MLLLRTLAVLTLPFLGIAPSVFAGEQSVPVRVRVVRFDGTPVVDARVKVRRRSVRERYGSGWPGTGAPTIEAWWKAKRSVIDAPVVAEATTNKSGWAQFDDLPAGAFDVTAHVADLAVRGAQVLVPPVEGVAAPTILLDAGHTIKGRVARPNGTAIAGALVVATFASAGMARWDDFERSLAAVADANGRFEIHGVPDGAMSLKACPPNTWFARDHTLRVPHSEPVEIVLPVRSLRAVIRDSRTGQAVPDATVFFATSGFHMSNTLVRLTTDREGRVHADVPTRFLGRGEILAPGYRLPLLLGAGKDNPPELESGKLIEMLAQPSAPLRGHVRDRAGGVANATVTATWLTGFDTESASTVTKADGSFALTARPGLVHLVARRPGEATGEDNDLDVLLAVGKEGVRGLVDVPQAGREGLRIALPRRAPAGRVTGRVVTDAGVPVSTTVRLIGAKNTQSKRTDAFGRFVIEGVDPGDVRLQVRPIRGKTITRGPISVHAGETSVVADWIVPASFTGRSGKPVQGRLAPGSPTGVYVVDFGSGRRYPVAKDRTFAIPACGTEIEVVGSDGWGLWVKAKPVLGKLILSRPEFAVFRVLASEDGPALPDATVQLEYKVTGPVLCGNFEIPTSLRSWRADETGSFRIPLPHVGEWILRVRAAGRSGRDISASAVGETVVLGLPASLAGQVRFDDDTPVAGLRVLVSTKFQSDAPRAEYETRTDADGRFALKGLAPDKHMVVIESAPGSASIVPWRRGRIDAPNKSLVCVVKRAPSITGRVLDVRGRPVTRCEVTSEPDGIRMQTDAQGLFRLAGTTAGRKYKLEVWSLELACVVARADAVLSGAKDIVVRADRGYRITGRLLDGAGRPRAGWVVGSYGEQYGDMRRTRTDAAGKFVIDEVPGGEWTLKIGRYGHHKADAGGENVRAGAKGVTLVMK